MEQNSKIVVLEVAPTGVTVEEVIVDTYNMRVTPGEHITRHKGKIPSDWRVAVIIAPELARTIESVINIPIKDPVVITEELLEEYVGRAVTELFHRERSLVAKALAVKGSELVLGDVSIKTMMCDGALTLESLGSTVEKEVAVVLRVTIIPLAIHNALNASMNREQIVAINEREVGVLGLAKQIMKYDVMLLRADNKHTYCTRASHAELRYDDVFLWSANDVYETAARELHVDKKIAVYCTDIYNERKRTIAVHERIGDALRKELQLLAHGIEHAAARDHLHVVTCIDDARVAQALNILIVEHPEMAKIPMQIIDEAWLWNTLGVNLTANGKQKVAIATIAAALDAIRGTHGTIMNKTAHRVMQWLHGNYT